jgi:hypothetical protein
MQTHVCPDTNKSPKNASWTSTVWSVYATWELGSILIFSMRCVTSTRWHDLSDHDLLREGFCELIYGKPTALCLRHAETMWFPSSVSQATLYLLEWASLYFVICGKGWLLSLIMSLSCVKLGLGFMWHPHSGTWTDWWHCECLAIVCCQRGREMW